MPFKVYIEFTDGRDAIAVICDSYKVSRGCLILKHPNIGYSVLDRNPDRIFYPLENLKEFTTIQEDDLYE